MSMEDAIFELTRAVGRIEADVATIKTDVADLKAAPSKRVVRLFMYLSGFTGLAMVGFAAAKALGH